MKGLKLGYWGDEESWLVGSAVEVYDGSMLGLTVVE
jgi:hypothetical protein